MKRQRQGWSRHHAAFESRIVADSMDTKARTVSAAFELRRMRVGLAAFSSLTELLLIGLVVWGIVWLITAALQPPNAATELTKKLDPIFHFSVPSDGSRLILQRGISEISSIDLKSREKRIVYRAGNSRLVDSRFSRDGDTCILLTDDQSVIIFRDDELLISQQNFQNANHCCLSADGSKAALVWLRANIRCWDLSKSEPTWSDFNLVEPIDRVVFDSHGETLVVSTLKGRLDLYDVKSGNRIQTLAESEPTRCDPVFSEDGQQLAVASGEWVTLYDSHSGEIFWRKQIGDLENVQRIAMSPGGKFIAASCKGGLRIVETTLGRVVHEFSISDQVKSMAFSPSADLLYVGNSNCRAIRVWSLAEGKELVPLEPL